MAEKTEQELKDELRKMWNAHDKTYQYSDDFSVWRRGNSERTAIELFVVKHGLQDFFAALRKGEA